MKWIILLYIIPVFTFDIAIIKPLLVSKDIGALIGMILILGGLIFLFFYFY